MEPSLGVCRHREAIPKIENQHCVLIIYPKDTNLPRLPRGVMEERTFAGRVNFHNIITSQLASYHHACFAKVMVQYRGRRTTVPGTGVAYYPEAGRFSCLFCRFVYDIS